MNRSLSMLTVALVLCHSHAAAQEPAALVSWEEINRVAPDADVRLQYGPDSLMFGDLRVPPGSGFHPVVVVIHGGCWRAENDLLHISHLSDALRNAGVATWTLEYRRVGNPGGGWPGTFEDVVAGANHLLEFAHDFRLDLNRVFLLGHSAGGQLALWLAAHASSASSLPDLPPLGLQVRSVISLAGVTDLAEFSNGAAYCNRAVAPFLGGTPDEVAERYEAVSPTERSAVGIPVLLIHGRLDPHVPLSQSEAYRQKAEAFGQRVRLHVLEAAGHFDLIAPFSAIWPDVESLITSAIGESNY